MDDCVDGDGHRYPEHRWSLPDPVWLSSCLNCGKWFVPGLRTRLIECPMPETASMDQDRLFLSSVGARPSSIPGQMLIRIGTLNRDGAPDLVVRIGLENVQALKEQLADWLLDEERRVEDEQEQSRLQAEGTSQAEDEARERAEWDARQQEQDHGE